MSEKSGMHKSHITKMCSVASIGVYNASLKSISVILKTMQTKTTHEMLVKFSLSEIVAITFFADLNQLYCIPQLVCKSYLSLLFTFCLAAVSS